MRNIVTISIPDNLSLIVNKEVKKGNFATKSEFFRHLLRMWIENRMAPMLERESNEIESGKGKVLNTLRDLR